MTASILPLVLIIFLATVSGYFSLMETSLNEGRHGRLEKLSQDGDKDAQAALKLLESPVNALYTAQIGITVTGILAGWSSILLAKLIFNQIYFFPHAEIISLIISLVFVTFIILLFGDFLPIRAAQQSPEKFLLNHHKSIRVIIILMTPLVFVFEKILQTLITKFLCRFRFLRIIKIIRVINFENLGRSNFFDRVNFAARVDNFFGDSERLFFVNGNVAE